MNNIDKIIESKNLLEYALKGVSEYPQEIKKAKEILEEYIEEHIKSAWKYTLD